MARRLECKSNCFCYICGKFTTLKMLKSITADIENRYNKYFFPVKLGDQNKSFTPHHVCSPYVGSLSYKANKKKCMTKGNNFSSTMRFE